MSGYDMVVLGAGPGGYVAALRAAQLGARVAVVEARDLGGVCLNRGCIPAKALLASSALLQQLKRAAKFGVTVAGAEVDYAAVAARKDDVVARLRRGVGGLLERARVDVLNGRGRLVDGNTVEVVGETDTTRVTGKTVMIATGSEAARPKMFPFDHDRVITSDGALAMTTLPASVLVVGGGYIGCEFASMWADFGCKVTLVEMLPRLLPPADADVSKEMQRILMRKRAKVHVGTKIETLSANDAGVVAELSDGKTVEAEVALVAVGRALNSDVDGLEALGVEVRDCAIAVDEFGRTNIESIRAIGDVTGKWLLAHYASAQGMCAAEHLFGGGPEPPDEHAVPSCVFTTPEIATVGLTEAEAREKDSAATVGRFDLAALGKAQTSGDTTGFVKIVCDDAHRIVGVHMVGHEVTSMIAEATLAVRKRLNIDDILHTIHAHPTMPEAFHEAALDVLGRAIHKM